MVKVTKVGPTHVLRMPLDAPAQQAIDYYFADTGVSTFRGRQRSTLPTELSGELRRMTWL